MNDIGKTIRALRIQNNMTQEELAHKCGYKSKVSINKIELERDIPMKKLAPIAKALGVTPMYLMGWNEDEDVSITTAANLFKGNDPLLLRLVKAYNQLPDTQKTALVQLAESMAQK